MASTASAQATEAPPQAASAKMPKLGTSTVTVLVGPDESTKDFILHADLVRLHSGTISKSANRLKAKSESEHKEPGPVRLRSYSADHFEVFCAFMYTGHVHSMPDDESQWNEWGLLARLWALGQSLKSTTFKDAVVDATLHRGHTRKETSSELPVTLAEHFDKPIGITNLLVDIAAAYWQKLAIESIPLKAECLPFYIRLIAKLHDMATCEVDRLSVRKDVDLKSNCAYHDHGSAKACYKKLCPTSSDDVRQKKSEMPNITTIMIEVHVGTCDDGDEFLMHAELAKRHSKLITTALKGEWKEGKEGVLNLPEVSSADFQIFHDFVNTSKVHFTISSDHEEQDWTRIAKIWLLGDFLESVSFKDAVVDAMLAAMRRTSKIPVTMYQPVFGGTAFPSSMRRLLVDIAVFSWFPDALSNQPSDPKYVDFFKDVAVIERQRNLNSSQSSNAAPYDLPNVKCHYHDHGSGSPCYKTMFGK